MNDYYYQQLKKAHVLSRAEVERLLRRAKKGCKVSRDKIIVSHLRLVCKMCNKYNNKKMAIDDLISYANLGLFKAIETFDFSKKACFSTHASWEIRSKITEFIRNSLNLIRIPFGIHDLVGKEKLDERKKQLGRYASEAKTIASIDCPLQFGTLENCIRTNIIDKRIMDLDLLMDSLSKDQKCVINLRLENYKLPKIAEIMKIDVDKVRILERQAIKIMGDLA